MNWSVQYLPEAENDLDSLSRTQQVMVKRGEHRERKDRDSGQMNRFRICFIIFCPAALLT